MTLHMLFSVWIKMSMSTAAQGQKMLFKVQIGKGVWTTRALLVAGNIRLVLIRSKINPLTSLVASSFLRGVFSVPRHIVASAAFFHLCGFCVHLQGVLFVKRRLVRKAASYPFSVVYSFSGAFSIL